MKRNQLIQDRATGEFYRNRGEDKWELVAAKAPGRNTPCGCGSGVKFKNCYLKDKCEV